MIGIYYNYYMYSTLQGFPMINKMTRMLAELKSSHFRTLRCIYCFKGFLFMLVIYVQLTNKLRTIVASAEEQSLKFST